MYKPIKNCIFLENDVLTKKIITNKLRHMCLLNINTIKDNSFLYAITDNQTSYEFKNKFFNEKISSNLVFSENNSGLYYQYLNRNAIIINSNIISEFVKTQNCLLPEFNINATDYLEKNFSQIQKIINNDIIDFYKNFETHKNIKTLIYESGKKNIVTTNKLILKNHFFRQ